MKTFASAWVAIFLAPLTSFAQLPVAPFSAPSELIIPSNMPGIRSGTYRLAPLLKYKTRDNYREDYYIQRARKRGSIVSYFLIERSLKAESEQENRYTARLYDGWFLPRYRVSLERFDCQNDQSMADFRIVFITDAWGDEGEGGFMYPTDKSEKNWEVTPGQIKVYLEGRPYWAMLPNNNLRFYQSKLKPEWSRVIPGTYGAWILDYACDHL